MRRNMRIIMRRNMRLKWEKMWGEKLEKYWGWGWRFGRGCWPCSRSLHQAGLRPSRWKHIWGSPPTPRHSPPQSLVSEDRVNDVILCHFKVWSTHLCVSERSFLDCQHLGARVIFLSGVGGWLPSDVLGSSPLLAFCCKRVCYWVWQEEGREFYGNLNILVICGFIFDFL